MQHALTVVGAVSIESDPFFSLWRWSMWVLKHNKMLEHMTRLK